MSSFDTPYNITETIFSVSSFDTPCNITETNCYVSSFDTSCNITETIFLCLVLTLCNVKTRHKKIVPVMLQGVSKLDTDKLSL
jgi:hypothetical protein